MKLMSRKQKAAANISENSTESPVILGSMNGLEINSIHNRRQCTLLADSYNNLNASNNYSVCN
jgi:hypothetical protein